MSLQIRTDFPGGNGIIEEVLESSENGQTAYDIKLHQDIRDTTQAWFYWYVALENVTAGACLRFHFTQSRAIGVFGPAFSLDDGVTWDWLNTSDSNHDGNSFSFSVPKQTKGLRFAFGIPYVLAHWQQFLDNFPHAAILKKSVLCQTRSGRTNYYYEIPSGSAAPIHKVALTSRHHCCEMIPNFVWEGFLVWLAVAADHDAQWLRTNVDFLFIPFVDLDGVEDGDQGKCRSPRDHGRDYVGDSIYPDCAAIRELLPQWGGDKLHALFDLHCPWIAGHHNETIYLVGSREPRVDTEQRLFSKFLEEAAQGDLQVDAVNFLPFGTAWNTNANLSDGAGICHWANELPQMRLATPIEIPYAHCKKINKQGGVVTVDSARRFGEDFGHAIAQYLQQRA